MMLFSRRAFVARAVAMPLFAGLSGPTAQATARPLLLYDEELGAGRRFAAHARATGGHAVALSGDRVRQMKAILHYRPAAIFGVSRHADQTLLEDVAREGGYRTAILLQHRSDGHIVHQCSRNGYPIRSLAELAGNGWPEAFAELAVMGMDRCSGSPAMQKREPAFSWVLSPMAAGTHQKGELGFGPFSMTS